jgi:hypothetical protein
MLKTQPNGGTKADVLVSGFLHGLDITIPKGTKIEAFTNGDATLYPRKV